MEVEKLHKSNFVDDMRGEPTVLFTSKGLISFNHTAVVHLQLMNKKGYFSVSICRDPKCPSDFSVCKDEEGWKLRKASAGRAVFNCVGLARHVIDTTWESFISHPVGVLKPGTMVFRIARLPLDDLKNRDVFALLRRKS